MNKKEHPLIEALRFKKKARKSKAHPKIVESIQRRIEKEAQKSLGILEKGNLFKNNEISDKIELGSDVKKSNNV